MRTARGRRRPTRVAVLLGTLALLAATGCGAANPDSSRLTVLAAASLTDTFTELAASFEEAHPGVEVRLAFGSSATLADQVSDGAPGDVLATADTRTIRIAEAAGALDASGPRRFATNSLVVAVPAANRAAIATLADLDRADVAYLTCVPTAPCGAAALALLERAGVDRQPVSQEVDVRAVLARVVADEADAGIVYRTDAVAAADQVLQVPIPGAQASPNEYWAAVTADAANRDLAGEWIQFLGSASGTAILRSAGFGTPR